MIVLSLKIYLLDVVETMFFFAGGQWPGTAVWILNCSFETQEWSQTRPHKLQSFQVLFAPERPHGPMCSISCPLCPFMPPKKSGWDLKSFHILLGIAMLCQLLPQATFKAMGFSFPDPDLLIFTEISMNPGKSLQMWQVCYRLADPKCQCLSSARMAGLTSYSKRNHQGKSRFAAGMEPEVGADKNQWFWNSSLFGHVFFSPCFAHQSGSIVKIFCEQKSLFRSVLFHPVESRRRGGGGGQKTQPPWCFQHLKKAILMKLQGCFRQGERHI